MQRQFFSGNTIEQAVMAAARHYKVEPEKLAYKLREKKHGFLNVRKRIVIVVDPDAPVLTEEQIEAQKPEAQPEPPTEKERPSRGRGRRSREEKAEDTGDLEDENHPDEVEEEDSEDSYDEDQDPGPRRSGRGRSNREDQSRSKDGRGRGGRRERDDHHDDHDLEDGDEDVRDDDSDDDDRGNRGHGEREDRGHRRGQGGRNQGGRGGRGQGGRDQGGRDRGGRDQGSRDQGGRGQRGQSGRDHNRRDKSSGSDRDHRGGRSSRGRNRKDSRRDKRRPVEINEFEWLGVDWDETEIKDEVERDLAAYELALEQVLDVMDLDIEYSLESGDVMELDFEGEDSEILLEDDGRVLKAIEHILPRMVRSLVEKSIPCNADCEGFRASHEKRLEDMAHDAAETAVETGRKKLLPPMNPADRRIVHLALVDREDVETVSEGHGFMKRVKVLPVDDPQMDDDTYDD